MGSEDKTMVMLQQQQQQQPSLQLQQPVSHQDVPQVISVSACQVLSNPNPPILVSNPADLGFQVHSVSGSNECMKVLQLGQVFQQVTGPNGETTLVLQDIQTAQFAQMSQQQFQQQQPPSQTIPMAPLKNAVLHPIPVAEVATKFPPEPVSSEPAAQSIKSLQHQSNHQQQQKQQHQHQQHEHEHSLQQDKKPANQIRAEPTVKNLKPNTSLGQSEPVKKIKEQFFSLNLEDRKTFLEWVVWRLHENEVEPLAQKLETKQRLHAKSKKGIRRRTGAKGQKIHACKFCPKLFSKTTHLTYHLRVHTGEKPFVCKVCDQAFAQSTGLKTHMLKHTQGATPFACPKCNKRVTTKGNLTLHMKLHSGERPFYCTTCDKSFQRKTALARHMKIHTDERPFSCEFCEKSFRRKSDKDTHVRIHTGEKPYTCTICSRSFSDQRNWRNHEKRHSGAMNCTICNRGPFQRTKDLNAHMATHNNEPQLTQVILQQQQVAQQQQPQQQPQPMQVHQQSQQPQLLLPNVSEGTTVNMITSLPTTDNKTLMNGGLQQVTAVRMNCSLCGIEFKDSQELETHINRQHGSFVMSSVSLPSTDVTTSEVLQPVHYTPLQHTQYNTTDVQTQAFKIQ